MRKYTFKFKDYDSECINNVHYSNKFEPYHDYGETDLDELVYETQKFAIAMGFLPQQAKSIINLHWNSYSDPIRDDTYLVTLIDNDYASIDNWIDDHWEYNKKEDVIAWAETPRGYNKE